MNLHQIVRGAITTVNPDILATIKISNGETVTQDGDVVPDYITLNNVNIQLQPLSGDMLSQAENLNLQGLIKSVHVNDSYYAQVRKTQKGGDLIIIDGQTWLVVQDSELWTDWCCVFVQLQVD